MTTLIGTTLVATLSVSALFAILTTTLSATSALLAIVLLQVMTVEGKRAVM